jgi:hypothetical protein
VVNGSGADNNKGGNGRRSDRGTALMLGAPDSGLNQQQESEENRYLSDERLKSRRHRERIVLYVKLLCTCASPTG